jgi:hypothetical protein
MATAQNGEPGRGPEAHRPLSLDPGRGISRRKFFLLASILSGVGVATYALLPLGIRRLIDSWRTPVLDRTAPLGRLSEQEMQTMIALLEILVPMTLWPSREDMATMVNSATEHDKGVLKEYKHGVALLDQAAREHSPGLGFAVADSEVRRRVVESLLWKYPGGRSGTLSYQLAKLYRNLERFWQSAPRRRFRQLVVSDLMRRFYTGSIAWKMVGYTRYPGIPGDPREYVRPLKVDQL